MSASSPNFVHDMSLSGDSVVDDASSMSLSAFDAPLSSARTSDEYDFDFEVTGGNGGGSPLLHAATTPRFGRLSVGTGSAPRQLVDAVNGPCMPRRSAFSFLTSLLASARAEDGGLARDAAVVGCSALVA